MIDGCSQTACDIERQVIGWYQSKPVEDFLPERLPTFIAVRPSGEASYGVPSYDNNGLAGWALRFCVCSELAPRDENRTTWTSV